MTRADIFREIRALPFQEQFEVLEFFAHSLGSKAKRIRHSVRPRDALPLLPRPCAPTYLGDPDLTAFTALDCEDFHASR